MTDTKFPLNDITVDELFNNGVCLTYQPFEDMIAFTHAKELEREYTKNHNGAKCYVVSKTATMAPKSLPRFHFFSNGILIHNGIEQPEQLRRIKKVLELRGYEIKKEYAPNKNNLAEFFYIGNVINIISREAKIRYNYLTDFEVKPLPDRKTFVENCFKNCGVLLTASKAENIEPEYRKMLALFEDGSYFISDNYIGGKSAFNRNMERIFWEKHPDYVYLNPIYVPSDYINALYKKAEEYDWYAPSENKSVEVQADVGELFNGRTCLSVHDKVAGFKVISPDIDRFALFSDGELLLSEDKYKSESLENYLIEDLKKVYPNVNFVIRKVPDAQISAIYQELPKYQKSAKTIYLEILKQKARKLKKEKGMAHYEALEKVAKKCGFSGWREATQVSEADARYGVGAEERWK